ncbi:hypothetical protein EVAR_84732_1 [Eumeta japonica]|uniref:Uncharacterized protein n=1 Tax=Eumeta variegata TaxID=151549 RepID=A0A4C1VQI1_EUMVA|nr:hypothetical protein EVAR_84732_1 [Eumeta japonica]
MDKRKNAALHRASAYPTAQYKSRALQHRASTRIPEVRNENWSDIMKEITPMHKAFWIVNKALKSEAYIPVPPFKRLDNYIALDDAEIAECLADSIEF